MKQIDKNNKILLTYQNIRNKIRLKKQIRKEERFMLVTTKEMFEKSMKEGYNAYPIFELDNNS